MTRLPLALSMGDPAGVGPELALAARATPAVPPFVVVGSLRALRDAGAALHPAMPVIAVASPAEGLARFGEGLPVIDAADCGWHPGQPDEPGARAAFASLIAACTLVREGQAAALVTGPIAKSRLATVGFVYPGQTECVAAECGVAAEDAVMMLAGPNLRVVPVTVHVALADVPGMLTTALVTRRSAITAAALARDFGIAAPRLAVAALNPHAGEDGRMGHEDRTVIAPAVAALRGQGIDATGPQSADTMFHAEARARYDVAICMYHDQALIPIKLLDFDDGVNVTLGLPIVRTSPDHGTAFGIAGQGIARVGATLAALRMAAACAERRDG